MMTANEFAGLLTGVCGLTPGGHVLAAVSGGADSVALLCLLCEVKEQLRMTVSCAHIEHGIRGEASLQDMAFVAELCKKKQIPFYAEQVDVPAYARQRGMGIEEAARDVRQERLLHLAAQIGADGIALAHHALDQAETVLMHAARGSDLRGLCGMQARQGMLLRPLLSVSPQELRAYLREIGQPWREDETNGDVAYARNRMRHQVIPALMAAYPGAVQALCRLASAAQRDEMHFAGVLREACVRRRPLVDGVAIVRADLQGLDDALLSRLIAGLLRQEGFSGQSAETIEALVQAVRKDEETQINLTGGAHVAVYGEHVYALRPWTGVCEVPLRLDAQTVTPFGLFTVRPAKAGETGDGRYSQVIPASWLTGAVVSGRRPGDTMIPFMKNTPVKLKKLMIDAGVERPLRNSLPVLRRGDTVLWAVTLRPSAYCRVKAGEQAVLVTFEKTEYTNEQQ